MIITTQHSQYEVNEAHRRMRKVATKVEGVWHPIDRSWISYADFLFAAKRALFAWPSGDAMVTTPITAVTRDDGTTITTD